MLASLKALLSRCQDGVLSFWRASRRRYASVEASAVRANDRLWHFWHHDPRVRQTRLIITSEITARVVFIGGAIVVGLAAVLFAIMTDHASDLFHDLLTRWPLLPLVLTPAGFVIIVWFTRRFFPGTGGSGIPQTVAAAHVPPHTDLRPWLSLRIAIGKVFLTIGAVACGASVGREGPTVQVGASLMLMLRPLRILGRVASRRNLVIAGGAAGIAAAFNTPLGGIMFAIEELSRYRIFRANSLTLLAVIAAGLMSLALLGNYSYFGEANVTLPWPRGIGAILVAGAVGGLFGGLFARLMIASATGLPSRLSNLRSQRPYRFAAICGLTVAALGILWGGLAFGTGYVDTRAALESGEALPYGAGLIKIATTWISYLSGIPGGIFAPSLGVGAGIGSDLAEFFPSLPRAAIILLVMSAYLAGFTQAPITSFIIVMEMSSNNEMLAPLMTAAVVGHLIARMVCPTPLYHALAVLLTPESLGPNEQGRRTRQG
ncbi:MAG TPA: chloride channel protein [Rhodocyclaceae bacterium]